MDFTRIDGINVMTAQTVISEVGLDMTRWKTESHFASWLGLCPNNAVSGGKVLRRETRKIVNRAATAFRIAASTLRLSDSYLGAQFRRFRAKLGAPKAITAMAHKLAVLFYRMLRFGQEYVDRGQKFYEERYRQQQFRYSTRGPHNSDSLLFRHRLRVQRDEFLERICTSVSGRCCETPPVPLFQYVYVRLISARWILPAADSQ